MKSLFGTAAVLAGGRSSRFGRNKALADFGGISLIEEIVLSLSKQFDRILVITGDCSSGYGELKAELRPDLIRNGGPLAGIHSALSSSRSSYTFITACDMPYPSADLISKLKEETGSSRPEICAARHEGFTEPFHAFYSEDLIDEIETACAAGEGAPGIYSFIRSRKARIIDWNDSTPFLNINSPDDLQKIRLISR